MLNASTEWKDFEIVSWANISKHFQVNYAMDMVCLSGLNAFKHRNAMH